MTWDRLYVGAAEFHILPTLTANLKLKARFIFLAFEVSRLLRVEAQRRGLPRLLIFFFAV